MAADFAPTITKKPATMNHQFTAISYSLDVLFYKVFSCRLKNTFSSCGCVQDGKKRGIKQHRSSFQYPPFYCLANILPFFISSVNEYQRKPLSSFLDSDQANILLKLSSLEFEYINFGQNAINFLNRWICN